MHHADGVPHILGRYRLTGKRLGRGNYASVDEAVQLDLETHVAIKIIDTSRVQDPYALRNLHREAALLRRLRHPHIIAIFECMRVGQLYCIVTELVAGGELSAYVQRQPRGHLDERTTLLFGAQLVAALAHMHERGVVHRDLKMRNILLSKTCDSVKIVDFGLSNFWSASKPLHTHCGSPGYAAPEIYVYNRTYGPEVDLWSLGVVFYAMAVGKLPFPTCKEKNASAHERRKKLLAQIVRGATDVHVKAMSHFSPPFRDLVQGLLTATAARRFTLQQAQEHPWLANRLRIKQINAQPYQLHSREHALILTKLAVMLNMPVASIEAHCRADRLGEVAAMYNILAHKQLTSYHSSWALRRAAEKERDLSERQRYLTSQSRPSPSSAPSGSQRCSVHTLPPWVPTGGRIPLVPRSVGVSDAMKIPPPTPVSQNESFPGNTFKSESWQDKQSSDSPGSPDLRSIIAAQSQPNVPSLQPKATKPSSQPEAAKPSLQPEATKPSSQPKAIKPLPQLKATTSKETNCCFIEKSDAESIPLVRTLSKYTKYTPKESALKEDFPLVGTLSKHTEESQKGSAFKENFKPSGEAEQSFRGSVELIIAKTCLKAKKEFLKLTTKESKTNESRKLTTKTVHEVHRKEVKDKETQENITQDKTSCIASVPEATANCQSNDTPGNVSHGNITRVQSHHTSIVLTKSAMATLSSALSNKTRKSVSFSLIALSDPSTSINNKSTLESLEIKDINLHNEPKNAIINGKECSRFKSQLAVSIEGTSDLKELSEQNLTELKNDTDVPSEITEDTSHERDTDEMSHINEKVTEQASSIEKNLNLKAVENGASEQVASISKIKSTESIQRKVITHNITGESHSQQDTALSKQSAINSENHETTIKGTNSSTTAKKVLEDQCSGPKFAAAILVKTSPILRALNPEPKKSMHEKVRLTGKSPKALYKLLKQQPKPLNLFDGYIFKNTLNSTSNAQTEAETMTDESGHPPTHTKINQEETDKLTQPSIELPSKQDEITSIEDDMMSKQEKMMSTQELKSKIHMKNEKSAPDALKGPKLVEPKEQLCNACARDKNERTVKKPVTKTGAENESCNITIKILTRAHSRMTERVQTTPQLQNAKHQCIIQGARRTHNGQITSTSSHRSTKPVDKDTSRNHPTTKANSSNCKPRLKARTRRKTQQSQRITPNKYKIDIALQKAIERSKRYPFATMNGTWNAVRRNSVHHKTERRWLL